MNAEQIAALKLAITRLGFTTNRTDCYDLHSLRVYFSSDNKVVVMAFVGAPGHSPVKYEAEFTWVPEAVIVATVKTMLATEKAAEKARAAKVKKATR